MTVKDISISATTDAQGAAQLSNIPDGIQTIVIFSPGYETKELKLTFSTTDTEVFIRVTNEVCEVTITFISISTFGKYSLFINAENITDVRQGSL